MPDKLPIDLPEATPGLKYVHGVNVDDLTDGPQGTSQKVALIPINREVLLQQMSTAASQQPSSLNTPIVIEFGAATGTPSDPVEIDINGVVTINEAGEYFVRTFFHYGRTTSTGEVELFVRLILNGSQVGNSAFARLDDDDTIIPNSNEFFMPFAVGDTFHYELIRDSSNGGINNGGLFTGNPATGGWADAPCSALTISRVVGNAANIQADGDVVGGGASQLNEVATYSSLTGLAIKSTSDVSIEAGVIDRLTADEDLWLRVDSSQENVIIGRHDDLTGVPSLNNTTLVVTANATNALAMVTTGNNSQSIGFTKSGVFRGSLANNRDRNSIGLANANGKYLEILPDDTATFLVDKIGIGRTASVNDTVVAFADGMGTFRMPRATTLVRDAYTHGAAGGQNWNLDTNIEETWDGSNWYQSGGKSEGCIVSTFQNTTPTLIIALDSYVRARLGAGQTISNNKNFTLGTDGAVYSGNLYRGVVTITFDYHIPPSLLNTKGYAFTIGRDGSPFTNSLHENNDVLNSGEYIQGTCTTLMELSNGAEVTLRVKQIVGTLEDDITFRNVSITFS